jgi:hypothetical protein
LSTFSLLPCQLAPYHRYTIESMLGLLLLVGEVRQEKDGGVCAAIGELVGDGDPSPSLVAFWLNVVLRSLRRAHSVLAAWYDLTKIHTGQTRPEQYEEVYSYCMAFQPRAPPGRRSLREPCQRYAQLTGFSLIGIPFQLRTGVST